MKDKSISKDFEFQSDKIDITSFSPVKCVSYQASDLSDFQSADCCGFEFMEPSCHLIFKLKDVDSEACYDPCSNSSS